MRWRFFSKPVGLDLERLKAAGDGNNRYLLCFLFLLVLNYTFMENPFEIIVEKLNAIENQIASIENKLFTSDDTSKTVFEIMSLNQLCKYYDFTKSYIYKQTSNRLIPFYKNGKRLYFKKDEIDSWILENRVKTIKDIEQEANAYLMRKKR
jgi:excisionase family DNA binding protein